MGCHSIYDRLMIVEVEPNENCDSSFFARFKEAGPARRAVQVRLSDRIPAGEWCWVTGWSDNQQTPVCQAYAQLIEDSGSGLAYVVFGGLFGLRFRPIVLDEPWGPPELASMGRGVSCAGRWS